MNWLNIYGENKSLAVALDAIEIGETVKADLDDAKRIRVSIANTFNLTGRGKFTTKQGLDEEGVEVLLITKIEGRSNTAKRIPNIRTFIEGNSVGVVTIRGDKAFLFIVPNAMDSIDWIDVTSKIDENKIIERSQSFCDTYGLTLID